MYIGESGNMLTRRITQHVGQIRKALDARLSQTDRENIRVTAGAQSRFYLHFARADHSQSLANGELVGESLLIEVLQVEMHKTKRLGLENMFISLHPDNYNTDKR